MSVEASEYRERCSLWFDDATLAGADPEQSLRHEDADRSLSAGPTLLTTIIEAGPEAEPAGPSTEPAGEPAALELVKEIGRGGMGAVFEARQPRLRRAVAVKTALDGAAPLRRRFLAEAYVTAALDHPNIVPVYDLDATVSGQPALAMKLVRGVEWRRLLQPESDEERARAEEMGLVGQLELLIQVGHAVAFAHSKGIVHCDIKPDNVMLGAYGEVFLMDWGAAVSLTPPPEPGPWAPPAASVTSPLGTPRYMAPEMAEGEGERISEATDVYLLGACLYEVLTGRPPHEGSGLLQVLAAAAAGHPPRFDEAAVSAEAAAICIRAMSADPQERTPSVKDFQREIREHLRHRESLEACARAEAQLASCQSEPEDEGEEARDRLYSRFADAIAGFQQAGLTWRGNERARQGELRARRAYARAALARGDIAFAASQASRLPAQDDELRADVERAGRARERTRRAARRLRLTLIAGAAIIVAGLTLSLVLIESERRAVSEGKRVISAQYDKLLRLSDAKRLSRLRAEEEELWPAWEARESAVSDWLERAGAVEANRAMHEETLAAMRVGALPYTEEDRRADRAEHPALQEAAALRAYREALLPAVESLGDPKDKDAPGSIAALRRLFESTDNAVVAAAFPRRFRQTEATLGAFMEAPYVIRATTLTQGEDGFDAIAILDAAFERLARRGPELLAAERRRARAAVDALDPKLRAAAGALRRALKAYEYGDRDALQSGFDAIEEGYLPRFNGWLLQTLNIEDPAEAGAAYAALSDEDRASVIARVFRGLLAEFDQELAPGLARLRAACVDLRDAAVASYRERELPAFLEAARGFGAAIAEREEALLARSRRRRTWRFADLGAQWEHDLLSELLTELESFRREVSAPAARRLADFRRWRARSLAGSAASWQEARAAIAAAPAYRGLELQPQEGLVPLGPDPSSGLWEFAVLGTGAAPERGEGGGLRPAIEDGVVLVLIPGGDFVMGAEFNEDKAKGAEANIDRYATGDEGPCQRVVLDAYFIAKWELSQAQWTRITGANPSEFYPGRITQALERFTPLNPVERMSWLEARGALSRVGLNLPTEAQWEFAARAGTRTPWWTGPRIYDTRGAMNIADRKYKEAMLSRATTAWFSDGFIWHAPIGSFPANPFGLHEVLGNVSEWCADASVSLLTRARPGDGLLSSGPSSLRAHRGGSYVRQVRSARSASREEAAQSFRSRALGVRPARPVITGKQP